MESIYLDYNATTPLSPEVIEVITKTLEENWANPSSTYDAGKKARQVIEKARGKVAKMIGANGQEIIFTSGGTESNNLVIYSAIQHFHSHRNCENNPKRKKLLPHIITTNIEHDSILLPLKHLFENGIIEVTFVPVSTATGQLEVNDIVSKIQPNTCLVTVMLANNETGILQPVSLLGKSIQQLNYERNNSDFPLVLFHTDAAQALGKISVNVATLHVDYLTIVGHKFYGPRIGALYFNSENNVKISPMFYGGGQERGYRPGTENTGMIAGLGKAAELVTEKLTVYQNNMKNARDYLEKRLKNVFGETICFNNHRNAEILPNTCSVAFKNEKLKGQCILEMTRNIQASVGAACHSNSKDQSILVALGVSKELSTNTLRLSTGRETTEDDIDKAVCYLQATVQKLCSYAN